MTKYRATRSFFGDLGSVRRNQLVDADETAENVKQLVAKGLLSTDLDAPKEMSPAETGPNFEKMTVEQLKAHAAEKQIDIGDASKKADIIAAIQLASEAPVA